NNSDEFDNLVLSLCEVIRDCRKKRNLSQSELSRRSGLHRSYIGDLERGARNLSVKNMFRLAVALDVSATELVKMAEQRMSEENVVIDISARATNSVPTI
ncbi:MAG: helix-turn-helix domain-containing protein, partial [Candidatus Obscuribacterales bacterium]|nr:helix-turn-helix domain-containing protein [Candidatus Obscuribacterales bacterium]